MTESNEFIKPRLVHLSDAHIAAGATVYVDSAVVLHAAAGSRDGSTIKVVTGNWDPALSQTVLLHERAHVQMAIDAKTAPPASADKLGYFLLSLEQQNEVLGDLKDQYTKVWLPESGLILARCYYVWHMLRASIPLRWLAIVASMLGLWKKFGS